MKLRIALIHDWLTVFAGAEKFLKQMFLLFPNADLFSVIDFLPPEYRHHLNHKHATTTFIQKLPFVRRLYRYYLPLMPYAIEQLNVTSYDLIISCSHAVAKGIIPSPDQLHICYCHSPLRYAWDMQYQYLEETGAKGIKKMLMSFLLHRLRLWDAISSHRVDLFVANSSFTARRIHKAYHRSAKVIYSGIEIENFPYCSEKEDFYLAASRLVPYKKIDMIVEAFSLMPSQKLIVIGEGPDFKKIAKKAGPNIQLLGYQPTEVLTQYLQRAKAFVFAAKEDFGLLPLEAQACGTPVIAFGEGGAVETVSGLDSSQPTGCFFYEQTPEALMEAVKKFERHSFHPSFCRENAERFSDARFREEFKAFVEEQYQHWIHTCCAPASKRNLLQQVITN